MQRVQVTCRADEGDTQVYFRNRGFTEAFPASSHDHFLLSSFSFRWITVRDILAQTLISQQETSQVNAVHFGVTHCTTQFPFRDNLGSDNACHHVVIAGCLVSGQRQICGSAAPSFHCLKPFCSCCGCPPSSLSSVLAFL